MDIENNFQVVGKAIELITGTADVDVIFINNKETIAYCAGGVMGFGIVDITNKSNPTMVY